MIRYRNIRYDHVYQIIIERPGTIRSPVRMPGTIRYRKFRGDPIHELQLRSYSL